MRTARVAGAVSLGAIGVVHVAWAAGSAWPARDRAALADAVGGFAAMPGRAACLAVASALGLAACAVARRPSSLRLSLGLIAAVAAVET